MSIWKQSVLATHHFLSETDFEELSSYMNHVQLEHYQIYVYIESEEPVGFISLDENQVHMLFVSPSQIRNGVGRTLMNFAIDHFNANKVDVNEQNKPALAFYNHLGFIATGRSDLDGFGKPYPVLHLELA